MRVLFCSLGTPGFLFPAIGLAQALAARGHPVAFATDLAAAPRLLAAGCTRLPRGATDGRSFETEHWFRPLSIALQIRHIDHAVSRFAPDLLVGQPLALGPLLVRERTGLPLLVQGLATPLWPSRAPDANASPATAERRAWREREMLGYLQPVREMARLGPPLAGEADPDESPLSGDLLLLRTVRELHGSAGIPGRVHLAGACLWEPEEHDTELDDWLDAARGRGAPIVYVQHGRTFGQSGFWGPLVKAFGRGALALAAATGRMDAGDREGANSASFFLRPHLPQSRVLRHAALMIGSATTTAVLGALSHGVPCLLIPGGGEQPDLAEQVERAGAARILAADGLTGNRLRRAVIEALGDNTLRRRARALQAAFAEISGFAVSADLLEALGRRTTAAAARGAAAPRQQRAS